MTTPHPRQPGRPEAGTNRASTADAGVPAIPQWVKEWGFLLLALAFLILTAMIANVGHDHGKGIGWFLFFLLLAASAGAWIADYERRLSNSQAAVRLKMYGQSCLEAADGMAGHQFEDYYAWLISDLGWTGIVVIGRRSGGDGGADILATDPRGRDFAIQCKRYALAKAIDIDAVRKLNGALAHEHPGRLGMIVTTSRLTAPAERLAAKSGVLVVARPALASQMARVRYEVDRKNDRTMTPTASADLP